MHLKRRDALELTLHFLYYKALHEMNVICNLGNLFFHKINYFFQQNIELLSSIFSKRVKSAIRSFKRASPSFTLKKQAICTKNQRANSKPWYNVIGTWKKCFNPSQSPCLGEKNILFQLNKLLTKIIFVLFTVWIMLFILVYFTCVLHDPITVQGRQGMEEVGF